MDIKNSLVGAALVLGLSVGQDPILDNKKTCDSDDISDSIVLTNDITNIKTSSLILETKKSVFETVDNPKNCETDELVNLFTAFENACKEDKK